ncbi:hypothetical protein L4D20_03960 [Vibrio kyushuensis]|uniref:hypothetical protein n=1 Tax=Vibrio kyushuensis TaxID=2910249 RepID=UPI003D126462
MGEAIASLLIIFGNPLAYRVGRLLISILTFGKLSIEPLPSKYPVNFVQAFDDDKATTYKASDSYAISHKVVLAAGYFVILSLFSAVLYSFRDVLMATKVS